MRASTILSVLATAGAALAGDAHRPTFHHKRHPTPSRRDVVSGVAYYGYQNGTAGACGVVSTNSDYIVGLDSTYYGNATVSPNCGRSVVVYYNSSSVTVNVTDSFNTSLISGSTAGDIYISSSAFEALVGSLAPGHVDVTWEFADSVSSSAAAVSTNEAVAAATTTDVYVSTSATSYSYSYAATSSAYVDTNTPVSASVAAATSAYVATSSSAAAAASSGATSSDGWTIQSSLTGEDFINFFNFDSGQSDNDGVANYVDGVTEGLVYTNSDGQVVIAVDTTEYVSLRNSVRMVSATTFNPSTSSLFIFDVEQIPAVCGVWPAIWFTGTDWPADGEIDVVEGVNEYTQNIFSIHTGDDCTMDTSLLTDAALVDAGETDCNAYVSDTACGAMSNSTASYGVGSNSAGGSVYALQLTSAGLEMYWWTKDSVPADITSGLPTPSTWGSPAVEVLSDTCDTDSHFIDLMMIVNTNLGGTFPEGVWSTDDAGGQDTSCATLTSYSDAASYIQNVGSAFSTAQWIINGFYIYTQ